LILLLNANKTALLGVKDVFSVTRRYSVILMNHDLRRISRKMKSATNLLQLLPVAPIFGCPGSLRTARVTVEAVPGEQRASW